MTSNYILITIFSFFFYSFLIILSECLSEKINLKKSFKISFEILVSKYFFKYIIFSKNKEALKNFIKITNNRIDCTNYFCLLEMLNTKNELVNITQNKEIKNIKINNNDFFYIKNEISLTKIPEVNYGS